jgi:hypothetical protein
MEEYSVDKIVNHHGKGRDSMFEVLYTTGDQIWLPYVEVSRLEALMQYLEAQNVTSINDLPKRVSRDQELPIFAISRSDIKRCQDGLQFLDNFGRNFSQSHLERNVPTCLVAVDLPAGKRYKRSRNIAGDVRTQREMEQRPTLQIRPHQVKTFQDLATSIKNGTFDVHSQVIPAAYINFCYLYAHHPDLSLRFPLPTFPETRGASVS